MTIGSNVLDSFRWNFVVLRATANYFIDVSTGGRQSEDGLIENQTARRPNDLEYLDMLVTTTALGIDRDGNNGYRRRIVGKQDSGRRPFSQLKSCALRFSIKPFSRYRTQVRKVLRSVTTCRRNEYIIIIIINNAVT